MAPNNSKLESLNGIRGFAVLLVLLSHSSASGMLINKHINFTGAGRYGVFLFFVLSSFLLTRQFFVADKIVGFSSGFLQHYFLRRICRIYPLFTASLIVYSILFKMGYLIVPITGEMIVKSLLLLDAEGIFWTIPVEFQYYFILPIVAYLLSLSFIDWKIMIIGGVIFCCVWTSLVQPAYTVNVLPFVPVFIIGSLAAKIYCSVEYCRGANSYDHTQKFFNIASLCALSTYIILIPNFYNILFSTNIGRVYFHNHFLLLAFLSAALILFTLFSSGIIRYLMESKFFVFWGKVSFSAYLGHKIILSFVNEFSFLAPSAKFFIFISLTALCSYLSYRFFERPLASTNLLKSKIA